MVHQRGPIMCPTPCTSCDRPLCFLTLHPSSSSHPYAQEDSTPAPAQPASSNGLTTPFTPHHLTLTLTLALILTLTLTFTLHPVTT